MARQKGTKNNMRSPKEKEQIVLEAFKCGPNATFKKYGISKRLLHTWMKKYRENGIDGLISKTGMSPKPGNGLKGLYVKKNKTNYSIAMGHYFIEKDENISYEAAMKKAEELMYADKANYYISNGLDRRRQ